MTKKKKVSYVDNPKNDKKKSIICIFIFVYMGRLENINLENNKYVLQVKKEGNETVEQRDPQNLQNNMLVATSNIITNTFDMLSWG